MKFGSVCSGIEAASVALTPLGFEASWFSEIADFPSRVLKHHYPDIPNHGDMNDLPDLNNTMGFWLVLFLCESGPGKHVLASIRPIPIVRPGVLSSQCICSLCQR